MVFLNCFDSFILETYFRDNHANFDTDLNVKRSLMKLIRHVSTALCYCLRKLWEILEVKLNQKLVYCSLIKSFSLEKGVVSIKLNLVTPLGRIRSPLK